MYRGIRGYSVGDLTAGAGTAITAFIPPKKGAISVFTALDYRCEATAHTLTLMRSFWRTTLNGSVAAAGTSVTITNDGGASTPAGALANGDWVVIQCNDRYFLDDISGLSGLTFTVAALPAAAASGNALWVLGVPGDHVSSQTSQFYPPSVGWQRAAVVSLLNTYADYGFGLIAGGQDEPLMFHSNNATNAGTLKQLTGGWALGAGG